MKKKIYLGIRILVFVILIQTLRFKFTAHPVSVYIFSKVGLEPFGRIGIGIVELIAGVLLLLRKTVWLGSWLVVGVMAGAVFMHITKLGIEVNGDGGSLFYTAVFTLIAGLFLSWVYKEEIPIIGEKFKN